MNTNGLLTKAGEKLKEAIIDFESDKKQLAELTRERGNLLALELLETKLEQKDKVTKLSKTIINLKTIIEDTPLVISALKAKILSLRAKAEKEDKEKAKISQTKLEILLHETSLKLIPKLKETVELNKKLKTDWASWGELDKISSKGLTDKKCLRPSKGMLELVCRTLLSEWAGQSDGEVRRYYSKDHYRETKIIF